MRSTVQDKNCRSYESDCAYIPGSGTALLAYAITAIDIGWLCYRW
ncbi:hypothetical protein [Streptomyces sp. HC307]